LHIFSQSLKGMKKSVLVLVCLFFALSAWSLNYCQTAAFGYGKSATGGAGGTVKTVTDGSSLSSALSASGKSIIIITKDITITSMIKVKATDKTLLAMPGITISNLKQDASNSGILYFKSGSKNLIIRNVTFIGPGAYDCDGNDLLCFDGVTNAWVDHCDFQDGCDGNFDNKGNTDNVTVSWCRFHYLKSPKAGGSGGTDDHRFTNLLGSNSSDKPADGTYNMTWAYCWWDSGCKERMVRCRNASLHFLNCYWNSSVANYYIGPENVDAYVEGCTIEGKPGKSSVFKSYGGKNGSNFVNCSGTVPSNTSGRTVLVPSTQYTYTAETAATSKTMITNTSCGAGATLTVTTAGAVSASCDSPGPQPEDAPTLSDPANKSQTVTAGTAIATITFTASGTATSISVTGLPTGLTSSKNGLTITISGTPTATGTYTVTATNASGATAATQGTITVGTAPEPEEDPELSDPANKSQEVTEGKAITSITFTASGTATSISVSALPAGLTSSKSGLTITIKGTPTASGSYTVTAKNASGASTENGGYITVNPKVDPVDPVTPTDTVQSSTWWNFSDADFQGLSGDLTKDTVIRQFHIQATSDEKMKANSSSKKCDGIQFGYRIQMVGEGSVDRHFWFDVKDSCTIDIYMLPNSSSATYKMNIAVGALGVVDQSFDVTGSALVKYTYTYTGHKAARIYLSSTGGINVYGVRLTYASQPTAPVLDNPTNKSQTVTAGSAIEPITYTASGTATDIAATNLPAGLSAQKSGLTLTISGTPTASGTYTVTATDAQGGSTTSQGTITVNTTPGPTPGPTPQGDTIFWNFSDAAFNSLGTILQDTTINGLTIAAEGTEGKVVVDANSKSIDGYNFTTRAKTGGAMSASARYLSFTVKGTCTVIIYCMSSSSSATRTMNVATGTWNNTKQTYQVAGSAIGKYTYSYTGTTTTIYVGADGGLNFYAIKVIYPNTPTALDEAAAPALPSKILRNGQILILHNGHYYNLQGMRVGD